MKKIIHASLLFFVLSSPLYARATRIAAPDYNNSVLSETNSETGLVSKVTSTADDTARLSLSGHILPSISAPTNLTGFGVSYAHSISDPWWIELKGQRIQTQFDVIAENREATSSQYPQAEENFRRKGDETQTLTSVGFGPSLRFKLDPEFLSLENWFQQVNALITYNQLDESGRNLQYTGLGLSTTYSIGKRMTSYLQGGLALSYNAASLMRPAVGDEPKNARRLNVSWVSLAIEVSFYF